MKDPGQAPIDIGIDGLVDVTVLGSGGSAVVYRARQVAFDRPVAVKIITAPMDDTASRTRFQRERLLSGRLSGHPNIARVYEAGFTRDGRPYLSMEYYGGGTLADRVAKQGPQPVGFMLDVGVKMCGAAATAESAGIIHRDIKPANVLLDGFGEPHLADFGISGLAADADQLTAAFTARYAAPEVLAPEPAYSAKSDQYSLALTLAFILAGKPPDLAMRDGDFSLLTGAPRPVTSVLAIALATDPADRFDDFAAMGRALQEAQRRLSEPVTRLSVVSVEDADGADAAAVRFVDEANQTRLRTGPTRPHQTVATEPGAGWDAVEDDRDDATRLRSSQAVQPGPQATKRSKKKPLVILAAIVVSAVMLGGLASVLVGSGGDTSPSNLDTSSSPATGTAKAPANLQINTNTPSKLSVTWIDTNNGSLAYAGYVLSEADSQVEHPLDFATDKGATSADMPGQLPGQRICVIVFPLTQNQDSDQRAESTATTCTS